MAIDTTEFARLQATRSVIGQGMAPQLSNILRDVAENCLQWVLYLPPDEIKGHGIDGSVMAQGVVDG